MPTTTGARLLTAALAANGIRTIFGVPGDTGVVFYDELSRTTELRHVLARDERHAAYMADGYVRSCGRLAACEASSGAGAVYLASGLAEACASRIPIIAITTDIHRASRGSGAITEIDQEQLFAAVTTWRATAGDASELPGLVARAVAQATGTRPGPVVIVVPEDVLEQQVTDPRPPGRNPIECPAPEPAVVRAVATAVASARRPTLLAGGGVHTARAWPQLRRLVDRAGLPVATTIHGKGALGEDHPLALGVAGGNGSRGYANEWLSASDLVVITGSRANSTDTNGFTLVPRTGGQVVRIDCDADRARATFAGSTAIVADLATALDALADAIAPVPAPRRDERTRWIADHRRRWHAATHTVPVPDGVVHPVDLLAALAGVHDASTCVVGDPGTPTPNLAAYWTADGRARRVIVPRGHGPMGYALPASIGAALAQPHERILCLTTEGSLAMAAGDWETAARLDLPITFVVCDNVSFAWIKMLQHLFLDRRYFGVEPGPIDAVQLAHGLGVPAQRAQRAEDVAELAAKAASSTGPFVIHVRVPEHQDAPPPVAPWQAALSGRSGGRPVY